MILWYNGYSFPDTYYKTCYRWVLGKHSKIFLILTKVLHTSDTKRPRETNYRYFELFLESVSGFSSVPASMAGYYTTYPAILQQSLATLFPYLENLKDHLTRGDPSSPFLGAAKVVQKQAPRSRQPILVSGFGQGAANYLGHFIPVYMYNTLLEL